MTGQAPGRAEAPFWTYEYLVLLGVALFGFGNIAVFYGFVSYLEGLGVPPAWQGPLLAAEPLAALVLRPVLAVRLTPEKALRVARLALVGIGLALVSYRFALWPPALLALRILHGLAFVSLVSAVVTLLAQVVRPEQSGRAFSYYSLATLLPQALAPLLAERLLPLVGGEAALYAWFGLCVLPALGLLVPLGRSAAVRNARCASRTKAPALSWGEALAQLRRPALSLLLAAGFCLFVSTSQAFFYMKPFAAGLGLVNTGLYFAVVTGTTLLVRLLCGRLFDRVPRRAGVAASLLGVAACLALYGVCGAVPVFLGLGACYGACLGAAMPLLNAALFVSVEPRLRPMGLNLLLSTMDAGFVLGPLVGGAVLVSGAGYGAFFGVCAVFPLLGALCALPLAAGDLRARLQEKRDAR